MLACQSLYSFPALVTYILDAVHICFAGYTQGIIDFNYNNRTNFVDLHLVVLSALWLITYCMASSTSAYFQLTWSPLIYLTVSHIPLSPSKSTWLSSPSPVCPLLHRLKCKHTICHSLHLPHNEVKYNKGKWMIELLQIIRLTPGFFQWTFLL